jgi:hypothetical protein
VIKYFFGAWPKIDRDSTNFHFENFHKRWENYVEEFEPQTSVFAENLEARGFSRALLFYIILPSYIPAYP